MRLNGFHFIVFGDFRQSEITIQLQASFHLAIALLVFHPMTGGEDENLMPPQLHRLSDGLAAQIISTRMMRRK